MKRVAVAAFVTLAAIALVCVVLLARGRDSLKKSDEALAKGDFASAIVFAERAAQTRLPGSPYPEQGYARLGAIADERAGAGDVATARAALHAIVVAAQTTNDAEGAHAKDARDRLAKLDPKASGSAPGSDLAPAPASRVALAAGVILMALGLAVVGKRGAVGWTLLALGIASALLSALS